MNLFDHLWTHVASRLDAPAVRRPGGGQLTYRALFHRATRMAEALRQMGVQPGGRVAAQVDKSEDALALYLGALCARAVFVPLNPTDTAEEAAYVLDDSGAGLFLCQPERQKEMEEVAAHAGAPLVHTLATDGRSGSFQALVRSLPQAPTHPPIPDWGGEAPSESRTKSNRTPKNVPVTSAPSSGGVGGSAPDVERGGWVGTSNLAVILYTSGTTGKPKGAMLTHENIVVNVEALHGSWGWQPSDVLLHALPLFHIHGLFVAATVALRAGASMILLPRFEVDAVLRLLPQATVFMGVPTIYHRLAGDARLTPGSCAGVRLFTCGSAPLSERDFDAFRRRTGHTILERYGMTETGMITSNPLHGVRKPGSVGVPLPGVDVRLVDPEHFGAAPDGDIGEIWVRGANIFVGYLGKPEATAEAFVDGWFRTGDLAQRDVDGYYQIVGRRSDLIITGGLNVYPAEVEAVLNEIEGVDESAVVGLPDDDLGERVTAILVPEKARADLTPSTITAAARARLAPYKCPRQIEFVDSLPRNSMGKIEKAQLRRAFSER